MTAADRPTAATLARARARRVVRLPRGVVGLAIDAADRLERMAEDAAAGSTDEDARSLRRACSLGRRVSELLRRAYNRAPVRR